MKLDISDKQISDLDFTFSSHDLDDVFISCEGDRVYLNW